MGAVNIEHCCNEFENGCTWYVRVRRFGFSVFFQPTTASGSEQARDQRVFLLVGIKGE
jgi:hypothetical protein